MFKCNVLKLQSKDGCKIQGCLKNHCFKTDKTVTQLCVIFRHISDFTGNILPMIILPFRYNTTRTAQHYLWSINVAFMLICYLFIITYLQIGFAVGYE